MAKRGPKPKIIDTTWTPDLAYVVGIFASDGNLGRDGMYLEITSKDEIILVQVLRILDMNHIKIGKKKSGQGHESYRIQFKRVLFHQWLCSLGLSPNKSTSIQKVNVPDQFFLDFVRGVFDGDGTIYRSKDQRWPNSHIVSIGFASGSIFFLEWLQTELMRKCQTTGFISRGAKVLQLRFAAKDSRRIFDAIYYQDHLPHLPRKFAKAKKIFTIHELS